MYIEMLKKYIYIYNHLHLKMIKYQPQGHVLENVLKYELFVAHNCEMEEEIQLQSHTSQINSHLEKATAAAPNRAVGS